VSDATRHERAREQTIAFMAEAARTGDYLDALQWLNTLASVDTEFTASSANILNGWRARAQRFRSGEDVDRGPTPPRVPNYQGLFGALLEQSYDGIVLSAISDGWMLECSRSFEEMTGYARHELLGRTSLELGLIEPAVRDDAVDAVKDERRVGLRQTPLRRKDGTLRRVEFSATLLEGDQLMLSIVRDITDRGR
jgi:PAS domain S-box-containing protein